MFKRIRSWFAWRAVRSSGVWLYTENTITGQRCAIWRGGGYQPLDWNWIRDGDVVDGPRGRYIVGTESQIIYG